MDAFFAPRKSARLCVGSSPRETLRQVRLRGGVAHPPRLTGYLRLLPSEILEQILGYCTPHALAALETTCSYFIKSGVTDAVARQCLREVPRAKGLRPDFRRGESYVTLLHFVLGQSGAAAQGTALALGAYHSVVLLANGRAAGDPDASAHARRHGSGTRAAVPGPLRGFFARRQPDGESVHGGMVREAPAAGPPASLGDIMLRSPPRRSPRSRSGAVAPILAPTTRAESVDSLSADSSESSPVASASSDPGPSCLSSASGAVGSRQASGSFVWGPAGPSAAPAAARAAPAAAPRPPAHDSRADVALHTFGRGFHGQLGSGDYRGALQPRLVGLADRDGDPATLYGGGGSLAVAATLSAALRPAGRTSDPPAAVTVPADVQLAVVAAGSAHTASISRRGELYTWGLASSGELGHGGWTPIEVCVPKLVSSLARTRVVSVAAGANHTLAISEAGQLWSCGRGRHGQLGYGHFRDEGVLTLVEALANERIVSAAAGRAHSVALAADGKVFTWGDARRGQLGHQALAGLVAGRARPQPLAIPFPQPLTGLDPATLRPPARVTAIAAGGDHTLAVTVGGSVLAWGSNRCGQLGLGDTHDRLVPTEVTLPRVDVGSLGGARRGRDRPMGPRVDLLDELLDESGDGEWTEDGRASPGELDRGRDGPPSAATAPWHDDSRGETGAAHAPVLPGLPSTPEPSRGSGAPPVASRAVQVACGAAHTLILLQVAGRRLVCAAGDNGYGQLGQGDRRRRERFEPIEGLSSDVACVAAGDSHCAAVSSNGELRTWGRGDCGQLGLGDDRARWVPVRVQGVAVVHPDRTLRRNRRPVLKSLVLKAEQGPHGR